MISFASAQGNLFNRIGKLGLAIKQMRSYQSSQLTNLTDTTNGVTAQFASESDIQALIGGSYIGILNSAGSIGGTMANIGQSTISRMVFRDQPQLAQNLTQLQLSTSIAEVIRQMRIAGATVLAATITATPSLYTTFLTNVGNGVVVASARRPIDGLVLENSFDEDLKFVCSSDSYSGSAQVGNEGFTVTGTGTANVFDFDWPLGSNARISISTINGNANNSQGNVLTNSGFETFSGNTPSSFTIEVGAAGSQIFVENSVVYDPSPSKAIRILGDGSTLTTISQTFSASSGTTGTLSTLTQYATNLFLRRDGVAAASGQMAVELVDSGGTIINDANGTANRFFIDLTGLTTTYTAYNGVFRTPVSLPSSYKIRLRQTAGNALTTGRSIYADKLALSSMNQVYKSGPYVANFAGSIPFAINDYTFCPISNSRGAGGTLDTFQTLLFRLFNPTVLSSEFIFPSSSSPSISDSALIA